MTPFERELKECEEEACVKFVDESAYPDDIRTFPTGLVQRFWNAAIMKASGIVDCYAESVPEAAGMVDEIRNMKQPGF